MVPRDQLWHNKIDDAHIIFKSVTNVSAGKANESEHPGIPVTIATHLNLGIRPIESAFHGLQGGLAIQVRSIFENAILPADIKRTAVDTGGALGFGPSPPGSGHNSPSIVALTPPLTVK